MRTDINTVEPRVTLVPATLADQPVLANLLELYVHDLSEAFAVDIGADGRFGYDALPRYFTEPGRRFAFLIRADERLAGFALVTQGSPASSDPDALDVAEFFVLRRHRRAGVGRRAAELLWERFPDRAWVVRVSTGNHAAVPFWGGAIASYTRVFGETTRPGNRHPWRVFTFRSRTAA